MTTPTPPELLRLLETLARAGVTAPSNREQIDVSRQGETPPGTRAPFDDARALLALLDEGQRINTALFRLFVEPSLRVQMDILRQFVDGDSGATPGPAAAPNGDQRAEDRRAEDDLFEMLHAARTWIIRHPVAAQTVFSKLVAEGREFAKTEEGAHWSRALAQSDLVSKGREVWETVTLSLLEERPETVIPRNYLEVLRVASTQYEDLLTRLRQDVPREANGPAE